MQERPAFFFPGAEAKSFCRLFRTVKTRSLRLQNGVYGFIFIAGERRNFHGIKTVFRTARCADLLPDGAGCAGGKGDSVRRLAAFPVPFFPPDRRAGYDDAAAIRRMGAGGHRHFFAAPHVDRPALEGERRRSPGGIPHHPATALRNGDGGTGRLRRAPAPRRPPGVAGRRAGRRTVCARRNV
ncbi:hypothetical protein SDC9_144999 [bioreactor metagenome]|uniref:Uncharacterized protein n=1 Tax=bioreactor metagenome TaxID=1076179 RepID=A0A645E8S4_9ZZZZ